MKYITTLEKILIMRILALLFVLLTTVAFGQENSRITVTVNESVELQATSFIYEVKMGGDFGSIFESLSNMEEYEEDYDELDFDEISFEELKELLKKEKFTYSLSGNNNFDINSTPSKEAVLVKVNSVSELGRLKEVLIDIEGISGSIKEVTYEDITSKYEEISEALLNKAKTQAAAMIKGTGKKLGDVYSIEQNEESKDLMEGFWGDYQKKLMSTAFGMGNENQLIKKVDVSYRYAFELN